MELSIGLLLSIVLSLVLVAANGFFVAVEFALVRAHPSKLRGPELKGKFGLKPALRLVETLDLSLSATQVGITIASLILGWWGEETFQHLFLGVFSFLGQEAAVYASHGVATALAIVVITILHVVLGELVCKSVAIRYPETTLRLLAGPMVLFTILLKPVIWFMNGAAELFLGMFGVKTPAESERVHSLSELAMMVSQSTERGVIDKTEEEMLQGVFNFSETIAREVMTPRPDLVTISVDATLNEVVEFTSTSGLSRFPVVGDSIDDVLGVILAKDLFPFLHERGQDGGREFSVRKIMREPFFVPGTKPIDDLLNEFKRRKLHLAIVLDEHGGIDGVVTLEDLLEEIVGDIFDESDETTRDIISQGVGEWLVDGGLLIADLNEQLELEIPEGDYDTISGFILTCLGRIPRQGDEITLCKGGELIVNGRASRSASELRMAQNGEAMEVEDEEELIPQAFLRVERLHGRRIETLRIKKLEALEIPETVSTSPSSQREG